MYNRKASLFQFLPHSQRPSSAYHKDGSRPSLPLQIASPVFPVSVTAASTASNMLAPGTELFPLSPSDAATKCAATSLNKLAKSQHMNSKLFETVDLALDCFIDKKRGAEEIKQETDEQKSDSESAFDDNEVVNNEEYANKKREVQDLAKELAEREKHIVKQKNMVQKLSREVRDLKTRVQDPLEIETQYKNMIIRMENELKEIQVRTNKYRELYLKEAGDRDSNHKSYVHVLRLIADELENNPDKFCDQIQYWVKIADGYKKSLTQSKQPKIGTISERDVAELNRLSKEIEQKEQEKKTLETLVEAKRNKQKQTVKLQKPKDQNQKKTEGKTPNVGGYAKDVRIKKRQLVAKARSTIEPIIG